MISSAIKGQLILLFFLKKTEEEVINDCNRAIKNITSWLDMIFMPKNNQHGIKLEKFIAAE
jgi:hypothetical protein